MKLRVKNWQVGRRVTWLDYSDRKCHLGTIMHVERKNVLWGAVYIDVKCDDGKYRVLSNPEFLKLFGLLTFDKDDVRNDGRRNLGLRVLPYRVTTASPWEIKTRGELQ